MKIFCCVLLLAALGQVAPSFSQRNEFNIYDGGRIPRALQPSLVQRINSFVDAQRDGESEKLAALLGPFSSGVTRGTYTFVEKEWVIQKLKEKPLTSFSPKLVTFSTASIDLPLSKRWWYIEGEAEYSTSKREKVVIAPYRHHNEWYFQPMLVTPSGWEPLLKPASNKRLERTRR